MRRLLSILCLTGCSAAAADRDATTPSRGPVVLELFTSQGCSSCPPADRWLASLEPGEVVAGRPVIPLAFHVDYWNDLGWQDPFSSEAWSERQAGYRHRVYTPQIVVAGGADAVGSKRRDVERLIAAAPAILTRSRDSLAVTATAPEGTRALAAIVEDGRVTAVTAGENDGAELREDHVVRALVALDGDHAEVRLDPAWGDVRVVVFAQAPGGAIVAARALE
jgi:hypothetical protein